MATILAFAGSNSSTSINFKLVRFTADQMDNHKIHVLNLANFPFPMYSEDHEKKHGFLNSLVELKNDIQNADGIIISVNEHNGGLSAYFKNVIDWLSRLDRDFIRGSKILLMSTSPGKRGAFGAHEIADSMFSRFGAEIVGTFSLPSFYDNFDAENGITDEELSKKYQTALEDFVSKI